MAQQKLDSFFCPKVPRLEEIVENDGISGGEAVKKTMQQVKTKELFHRRKTVYFTMNFFYIGRGSQVTLPPYVLTGPLFFSRGGPGTPQGKILARTLHDQAGGIMVQWFVTGNGYFSILYIFYFFFTQYLINPGVCKWVPCGGLVSYQCKL